MALDDLHVDFDLRQLGRTLQRTPTASGWVRRKGRSWIGIVKVRSVTEDGDVVWKTRKKKIGTLDDYPTKKEATKSKELANWVEGLTGQRPPEPESAMPKTFQAAWEAFLAWKDATGAWGAHHRDLMVGIAGKWILPSLGDELLPTITPAMLTDLLVRMRTAGLSRYSIIKCRQILSMVCDYAESERWLQHSPTRSKHCWSGRRDSNPQPTAWKAVTLPLSYSRSGWVLPLL
jgi:hypothetical protein